MHKRFITEEDLMLDGFRLAVKVYESGFRPTFIVGLWRGGAPMGIFVQECLQTLRVHTDHIAVRTSRTVDTNGEKRIRVHGTQYLLEHLNADDQLLIVDDVYGTGRSVHAVIERLRLRTKRNMPADVRIAVPWYRPLPGPNPPPDYFLHRCDDEELVFPYELSGLTDAEIAEHKPYLLPLLAEVAPD
ncbi:MAG TPA: phosphoribosyltransferase [Pseudomonadales bacterium]|nr:phosphoribosyltransferase [Pseudomonadales bacterium]